MNKISLVILCSFVFISFNLRGQGAISEMAAIRASYSNVPDRKIDGLTTEVGYDQWEAQAPFFTRSLIPGCLRQDWRYQTTGLDFSDKALLDEDRLHSIDLAFL